MSWLEAPDAWLGRLVFERGLALVYVIAFAGSLLQFRALLGSRGLLPIPRYLAAAQWRRGVSVFRLFYRDWFFAVVCWIGLVLAMASLVGLTSALPLWAFMVVWATTYALYLSIVNVGQRWYSFGWETLLCEAGFFAVFVGPSAVAPPTLVGWMLLWLLFRLEFGAGMIKMRGDRCWRDLSCLQYHHETQPMPGPLSWYFHRLPKSLHRVEVAANHVVQLVVPFLLFAPQPIRSAAAILVILTQAWLLLSGNFAWLNLLTIVIAFAAVDSGVLQTVLPLDRPAMQPVPTSFDVVVIALAVVVTALSWCPARNLVAPRGRQRMNYSWNPFHVASAYGAFGTIGRVRREVIIEGTDDPQPGPQTVWREYGFRGKPGDVGRRPRQFAPYHLRLDWLMWFVAISPVYGKTWFDAFLVQLLRGDRATLRLLRHNPFPGAPPRHVRALLYTYRFTTRAERRASGAWWARTLDGTLARPRRLKVPAETQR